MTSDPTPPDLQNGPHAALEMVERLLEAGRRADAETALAPILERFPTEFWVLRMDARVAPDADTAIGRLLTLVSQHPDEAVARVDLGKALMAAGDARADAVFADAVARFPRDRWVLDALARRCAQRGDLASEVAAWKHVLAEHPDHAPAQEALPAALLRMAEAGQDRPTVEAALREMAEAAPENPVPLLRLAELASDDPERALDRWALARALHPQVAATHLGYAGVLLQLGRFADRDEILGEARRLIPQDEAIVSAWTQSAGHLGRWAEAVPRAWALQALAPESLMASLAMGEALIRTGDPAAALDALSVGRARHPDNFWLGYHEVDALVRLGRWNAAFDAGTALYRRYVDEPSAAAGIVKALQGLGEAAQAESILRSAMSRFPREPWITIELARAAAARADWSEAISFWRNAGLPGAGEAGQLCEFAHALAEAGEVDAASEILREVAAGSSGGTRHKAGVALARLHVRRGAWAEAEAAWHHLAGEGVPADPDFAALTRDLATGLSPAAAVPMLTRLLCEPDDPSESWTPALSSALHDTRLRERLNQALAASSPAPDSLAPLILGNLTDTATDADQIAARIARAVGDGRMQIAAMLLGSGPQRPRAAQERVGLRLYVNQRFAAADAFEALAPRQLLVLLAVARCFDPDSLAYLLDLARERFAPASLPELPTAEAVCGRVAHASLPLPVITRSKLKLRIALCLHGTPVPGMDRAGLVASIGAEAHDVTIVAHLWHSATAAPVTDAALLARLPAGLRAAMHGSGLAEGMMAARALYPALLGAKADPALDEHALRTRLGSDHVVVEQSAAAGYRARSAAWLARYKTLQAHRLAVGTGTTFDLFVHLRADSGLVLTAPDWSRLSIARGGRLVFADAGYHLRRDEGLSAGADVMIGGRVSMDIASDSFALGEMIGSGRAKVFGFSAAQLRHGSLGAMLHLNGIAVERIATSIPARGQNGLAPLSPADALALLWTDLRARPPVPQDSLLLKAATAEVTGGLAV